MSALLRTRRFNDQLRSTISFLRNEYPNTKEITDLERKADLALSKNTRSLYDAFKTYIKDIYGAKISASDDSFIDDAKHAYSDHVLLPCIVQCWEQPGAQTKDTTDMQVALLTKLQQLCDLCI